MKSIIMNTSNEGKHMLSALIKKSFYTLFSFTLVLSAGISRADDTEIYFTGNGQDESVRPNVLFILDTSGSMQNIVQGTGNQTRLEVMKEAVKQVIADIEDINVGLMRFTDRHGGPVLFPVTYVEENAFNVVGETATSTTTLDYVTTINNGLNDGEMNTDDADTMYLNESQIEVDQIAVPISTSTPTTRNFDMRIDNNNRDSQQKVSSGEVQRDRPGLNMSNSNSVGLRFDNVDGITGNTSGSLQNALITRAYIEFAVKVQKSGTTNITIYGEDADRANRFSSNCNNCFDITTRTKTNGSDANGKSFTGNGSVAWNGVAASSVNAKVSTPDLTNIVQEIVSRGCTSTPSITPAITGCTYANDDMVFIFEATTGNRNFHSYDGSNGRAPRLFIEYNSDTTTTVNGDTQIVGLRFENIRIPQGATISNASLVFTPNNACIDDPAAMPPVVCVPLPATTWNIKAEATDNSSEFNTTAGDFLAGPPGNRTRTAETVAWNIGTNDWTNNVAVESSSITNLLQEVVNRTGWCGGNSISFFITGEDALNKVHAFASYESSNAVRLRYSYTASSGCFENIETSQTSISNDDAEQAGSVVNTIDLELNIGAASDTGSDQTIGLRFQDVEVPQGATIIEAELLFVAEGTSTGTATFTIKGIDDDDLVTFSATTDDITNRATTTASVPWVPEDWLTTGERYETTDISTIVKEIVDRTAWASGNNMGFIIEAGTGERIATSNNGDPAHGPRLRIRYSDTIAMPFKSVRESLIEIIDDLPANGSTPIQRTLYEAARYWRGESMEYGDRRQTQRTTRISHAGSYCTSAGNCRGAKENSGGNKPTDAFGIHTPLGCNVSTNPSGFFCEEQVIIHDDNNNKAKYISPFSSELTCANNYQVLLTDGAADAGRTQSPEIVAIIPKSSCYNNNSSFKVAGDADLTYDSHQSCAVDLAEFMATVDQSTSSVGENLANNQFVKTYTIGFNLGTGSPTQFIKDIANRGEGEYYSANTSGQLVDVFTSILTDVKSDPTSFASPSLATNAFNRLVSRNDVYFGLFTPQLSQSWLGNVNKYRICNNSGGLDGDTTTAGDNCTPGEILDANNVAAIDPTDGQFKTTAQSIWSNAANGKLTTQGGAGAEITDFTTQILYTDKNASGFPISGTALNGSGFKLTSATWDDANLSTLRSSICPTPSTSGGSQCENRMLWLLGKKIITDANNDVSTTQRWSVNDVLHSSPAVITYGGSDTNTDGEIDLFFDKVIYGTNDGMLHFVNGTTGAEEWRYLPSDFWSQQQVQYLNAQGEHVYGLDVTPTILSVDVDNDGSIEPGSGDSVSIFMAARRGGNYIYALDVTATVISTSSVVVPKFLWRIQGGTGSYTRLGQTWSQPQLTTILLGGTAKKVLIFGGGYDAALDDPDVYEPADNSNNDFLGNSIYIVDPADGSLIMSVSGSGTFANTPLTANISVPDMHYSIPSRISFLDSNADGITDRLYFGDTGGQVWRVDLDPLITAGSPADTVVGKLADISGNTTTTQRRFYEPPSVIQVQDTEYSDVAEYDYVLIGSGYRAHPLNSAVQDRFYAFRDRLIATSGLSAEDADDDGVAEAADNYPVSGGAAYVDTDLVDVTASALDATDADDLAADGWFYDFTIAGSVAEKVLSAPATVNFAVVFTTFKPNGASLTDPCQGSVGNASAYNFNILSAGAALDWDGNGDITLNDRELSIGGGIPSDVVTQFTDEGVVAIAGTEGGVSQLGLLSGLPRFRTYWYEE